MPTRECDCKEFQDSGHTDECNKHYRKEKPMKVFTCKFTGYYPVGASAVIVAETKEKAEDAMKLQLLAMNLAHKNKEVQLEELPTTGTFVKILTDGDY